MDCSPPGSSSSGFSRQEYWSGWPHPLQGVFPTQDWPRVYCVAGGLFTNWAAREALTCARNSWVSILNIYMLLSINTSEQATTMKNTKTGRFKMILSPQYCKWECWPTFTDILPMPQPQAANFCGFDYRCLWNTSKRQILFLFVGKYFLNVRFP